MGPTFPRDTAVPVELNTFCLHFIAELPSQVYLVHDGEKKGPRDHIRPRDPGPIEVNCEVVGGRPEPEIRLYTGEIPG